MKVFVYTKEKKPRKVAIIKDVVSVYIVGNQRAISITTDSGTTFSFSTKVFKTTIYQN
jgi:hypothetical protein